MVVQNRKQLGRTLPFLPALSYEDPHPSAGRIYLKCLFGKFVNGFTYGKDSNRAGGQYIDEY